MPSSKPASASKRRQSSKSHKAKHTKSGSSLKSSPNFNVPYFAHDELDPNIYPASVRQPVGGPCPTNNITQRDEEDFDGTLAESSSDDGNLREPPQHGASRSRKPKVAASPSTPGYRKVRVEGGRSAMPKKVVWDLDSDDEIIVKMKQERYTDKEVVERLIKEGRTKYHHKTISSRWVRLKRVLAAHEDELLDAQLTDWHEGDDGLLLEAITAADREVYQRKQKVAEEKWKVVAEYLKSSKPTTNYSQNACRNRFAALENDTATIPPELVDFPEQCRVRRTAVEEMYAPRFGKARQQHNVSTIAGNGGTGEDDHTDVLPKRGIGNSKTAANAHGEARTDQLFRSTSSSGAKYHSTHEEMFSSDGDSGADDEEESDVSVKISPDVRSSRNHNGHRSRSARAAVSTIPRPMASTDSRVRGSSGTSMTSQPNINVTSTVRIAKARPTRVAFFAPGTSGNLDNSR